MTATLTPAEQRPPKVRRKQAATKSIFDPAIVARASIDSFKKLNPRTMMRNPVMFIVWAGSLVTTVMFIRDFGDSDTQQNVFAGLVAAWLWFTVLFANFAEAMAEGRGKAQADTLRKTRAETTARVRLPDGSVVEKPSSQLELGDVCVVSAGEVIPGDGEIIEGIATVDESAITGESAPVIRESGGDRSAVTGGTRVLSDEIVVQITARPGETFLDRMIALVEGANRQKTPNEIALSILLAGLTIVFLLAVVTLQPFAIYSGAEQSVIVLVALLVCLIPTTIGGLLSSIGIAGMDRLVQRNVLAMSGRAVEAAGDVTTLLLDKTGTITFGSRQAAEFIPVTGVDERDVAEAALMSSLADETPEGRSIVDLAIARFALVPIEDPGAALVPFTAQTRMSGMDLSDGRLVRKGAADSVRRFVEGEGGHFPLELIPVVEGVSRDGATPLVVIDRPAGQSDWNVLGVIRLKDTVKPGMRDRFDHLRLMGIRTVMITGDNPLTAAAIADGGGRRRLPRRGHARGQDGADQARAARRQPRGDDRRRDERRPRARPGRCRRGDEQRDAGRQGGRQHGRPRQQPDQADRDRRGRQAAADHTRRADHVLDRQRRRQVLRHHPGDVLGRAAGTRRPQRDEPAQRRARRSCRRSSSTR